MENKKKINYKSTIILCTILVCLTLILCSYLSFVNNRYLKLTDYTVLDKKTKTIYDVFDGKKICTLP